jgi:predicted DNA-binding protein (MmcQ/YjbR family)
MQNLEAIRPYMLSKTGAAEDFPFGPETLVLKVGGKMFALIGINAAPLQVSLKCDPLLGEQLRDAYAAIGLAWHLNKRHWIALTLDGSVPDETVCALIDQSYELVLKGLTRAARQQILG